MDALVWSLVVPTGLYITRGLGSGVQTALRRPSPETLATDIVDVEGALSAAACALRFYPLSPTADHLRNLVSEAKASLERLVREAEERRSRTNFMRLFRDPDFRDTNRLLRAGVETLKSRVHLYLLVVNIFPEKFPREDNGAFERTVDGDGKEHAARPRYTETNELKYYGVEYARAVAEAQQDVDSEYRERWSNMIAMVPGLDSFIGSPPSQSDSMSQPQLCKTDKND